MSRVHGAQQAFRFSSEGPAHHIKHVSVGHHASQQQLQSEKPSRTREKDATLLSTAPGAIPAPGVDMGDSSSSTMSANSLIIVFVPRLAGVLDLVTLIW